MIQEALERAGFETFPYVGRGYNRKRCVAISCDRGSEFSVLAKLIANASDLENAKALAKDFGRASLDTLGMGYVLYFSSIEWEETEEG